MSQVLAVFFLLLLSAPIGVAQVQGPDLLKLSSDDQLSIEEACSAPKALDGPAAYHRCQQQKLRELVNVTAPDLSNLSSEDQVSIRGGLFGSEGARRSR